MVHSDSSFLRTATLCNRHSHGCFSKDGNIFILCFKLDRIAANQTAIDARQGSGRHHRELGQLTRNIYPLETYPPPNLLSCSHRDNPYASSVTATKELYINNFITFSFRLIGCLLLFSFVLPSNQNMKITTGVSVQQGELTK